MSDKIDSYIFRVLSSLPGSLYWKNKDGVYLGGNAYAVKKAGLNSIDELIGKTDHDLFSKQQADPFRENDIQIMATGMEVSVEEISYTSSDEKRTQLSMKKPLFDEQGNIIGVIGNTIDITELKATQETLAEQVKKTEQAYRSKTEFISAVSREIRNPIGNVISLQGMEKDNLDKLKDIFYTDIMPKLNSPENEALTKSITQLFQKVTKIHYKEQAEAHRSLNALQSLGELHRMQLTGITTRFEENNIQHLIDAAIKSSPYPNHDKVLFQIVIQPSVPVEAIIDYNNILAGLSIVMGNAIRFSPDKERVKVNVELNRDQLSSCLTIIIQDFGPGIHESQLAYLFGNFLDEKDEQRDAIYRKPSVQLPQAKMRIEASGGTLDIKSALHQGTTVYVNVPYRLSDSVASIRKNHIQTTKHQAVYILLIEDDATTQQITQDYLYELDYRVDIVSNGKDAIKMALKNNYDIALLDISLPDMNGLTVMREVRAKKKDDIIFVCLTSHTSEEDEEYFIEQGMMAVLNKPVNKNLLQQIVRAAVNVKKTLLDR